jgi:hypothetical protein
VEGFETKREENEFKWKASNRKEMIRFLASRIWMFGAKVKTYRDHWDKSTGKWHINELLFNRYRTLHQNMKLEIPKMFKILNSAIKLGYIVVIDELVAGTNTRSPVRVFIPRKPHPNGHLIYFLATKLENRNWFVFQSLPYLDPKNRPTPSLALNQLLNDLPESVKVEMI